MRWFARTFGFVTPNCAFNSARTALFIAPSLPWVAEADTVTVVAPDGARVWGEAEMWVTGAR